MYSWVLENILSWQFCFKGSLLIKMIWFIKNINNLKKELKTNKLILHHRAATFSKWRENVRPLPPFAEEIYTKCPKCMHVSDKTSSSTLFSHHPNAPKLIFSQENYQHYYHITRKEKLKGKIRKTLIQEEKRIFLS